MTSFCFCAKTHLFVFPGEGTNEQDPVKCSGVGCQNHLYRWYVMLGVLSVFVTLLHYYIYIYKHIHYFNV